MRGLRKRRINGALLVGPMMREKPWWLSYFWIGIALAMGACVKGEMTPRTLPEPVQVWTRGMGSLTGLALLEEPPALAVGLTTGLLLMDLTSEPPQGKWVSRGWIAHLAARPHAVTLAIACLRGCPSLALYDPPYEQPQHVLLREPEPVNDLAFSPDGRFLAAVTDFMGSSGVWSRRPPCIGPSPFRILRMHAPGRPSRSRRMDRRCWWMQALCSGSRWKPASRLGP